MRIAIVHYHLKRGGVTRVIESTLRGLETLPVPPHCVVLAGEVPEDFRYKASARKVDGLHYSNAQAETPDPKTLLGRMRAAAREALGGDPDCWHIHNHSLGKNSAMPGVVAGLAESGEAILLQMHDFAEDGRPENHRLNLERPECSACLYPESAKIRYAVINARDYNIFKEAGIPPARLQLLANPVEGVPLSNKSGSNSILQALEAKRLFLYPVRAVRRKNFGEMLLWAALSEEGDVFATTLGPTNQNYAAAYRDWQDFARRHRLPVRFGIGENFDWSFEAMVQTAHSILSTSIAEGFGLAFLEPWLFGKQIIGRDLPAITADFKAQGIELDGLYPSLPVPAEWIDQTHLNSSITKGLRAAYATYGRPLPDAAVERALDAISPAPGCIDFGGLDEVLQKAVIERVLADPSAKSELPRLEASCPGSRLQHNADKVTQAYCLPRYAEILTRIYGSVQSTAPDGATLYIDPARVLDGFLRPERFRLLRS